MMKRPGDVYAANQRSERDEYAVRYLPAVKAMAYKLKERLPGSIDAADLIAIGTEELVKLARKYDPAQNDSFWGYAYRRVYGAMLDYLRSLDVVSRADRKMIKEVDAFVDRFYAEHDHEPSDEEVARALGHEIEKIREARSASGVIAVMPITEQMQLESDDDIVGRLENEQMLDRIKQVLKICTEREQLIIQLYYFEELKLEEIAEILHVTTSRVSQIHKAVLTKVREALTER